MALSESQALARARATRASFPKGKITESQARDMFVAMADSQVGYASGSPSWSMYGKSSNWRSNWNGRQVYWCALFLSWCAEQAFGTAAARAGFGRQYPSAAYPPVGGTWTVWMLNWGRSRGAVVPFNRQRKGDICLTDWNRVPGAEVDHVDVVRGPRILNLANVIGGNTSSSSASAGAGVYRAARPSNRVRAIIEPDYKALVRVYNANIIEESDELSAKEVQEIKDYIDDKVGERVWGYRHPTYDKNRDAHGMLRDARAGTGSSSQLSAILRDLTKLRGERTNAHVKQMALLGKISDQVNVVGRIAREAREGVKALPAAIVGFRVPFSKGTSLHRLFGDDWRFGSLLGYAGASFVDRDTHTEEIVDALDTDAIESQMHAEQAETEDDRKVEELSEGIQQVLRDDSQAEADVAMDIEESVRALD